MDVRGVILQPLRVCCRKLDLRLVRPIGEYYAVCDRTPVKSPIASAAYHSNERETADLAVISKVFQSFL